MIRCKIDILTALRDVGMTAYQLRKQHIMGEDRVQRLRRNELPSWRELDIICKLTGREVADFIEYVPDNEPP